MTSTTAIPWRGYYRASKKHRWRSLAQAQDYGDALNALLDAVAKLPSGELLVSQRDPNEWSGINVTERRRSA